MGLGERGLVPWGAWRKEESPEEADARHPTQNRGWKVGMGGRGTANSCESWLGVCVCVKPPPTSPGSRAASARPRQLSPPSPPPSSALMQACRGYILPVHLSTLHLFTKYLPTLYYVPGFFMTCVGHTGTYVSH